MADNVRDFRAALAQNKRNSAAYSVLVVEILIWAALAALVIGAWVDSDSVAATVFVLSVILLPLGLCLPWFQLIVVFLLAVGWATPFVFLGFWSGWGLFYFLAVVAFFLSFIVNYWGITYMDDLVHKSE